MSVDPRTPVDDIERISHELAALGIRLERLESPSGTSVYQTVAKLQALVENIQAQLDAYNASRYTNGDVDARVLNPGILGAVNSSQGATFTSLRANGGLASTDVYSHLVTGGGAYRATWTHETGFLGYAPSSRRFKTDIEPTTWPLEQVLELQAVLFRYVVSAPYAPGDPVLGLIAEDVEAAGFPHLVDRDDEGEPFGVRYDLLALVVLEGMRDLTGRVQRLELGGP